MTRAALTVAALWLACAAPPPARADFLLTSRVADYAITFNDSAFGGTNVAYGVTENYTATPADRLEYTFSPKTLAQGVSVSATGGLTLSNVVLGVPTTTFVGTMSDAGAGALHEGYTVGAGANFNQSWVVKGTSGGLPTLEFRGDGVNSLYSGIPVTVDIRLAGNWTSVGTGAGQIQFVGSLDPGWSRTQFSYDAATNRTLLEFATTNYQAGTTGNIDFILRGRPVTAPAPGAFALALSGAACLAGFVARRRTAPKSGSASRQAVDG